MFRRSRTLVLCVLMSLSACATADDRLKTAGRTTGLVEATTRLPAYPDVQLARVVELVRDLLDRHGLGPEAVVGHSDIAPGRKQDPGEHFPWALFVEAGCAVGPCEAGGEDEIADDLTRIGYGSAEGLHPVIEAFQRRFRPASITGEAALPSVWRFGAACSLMPLVAGC